MEDYVSKNDFSKLILDLIDSGNYERYTSKLENGSDSLFKEGFFQGLLISSLLINKVPSYEWKLNPSSGSLFLKNSTREVRNSNMNPFEEGTIMNKLVGYCKKFFDEMGRVEVILGRDFWKKDFSYYNLGEALNYLKDLGYSVTFDDVTSNHNPNMSSADYVTIIGPWDLLERNLSSLRTL